METLFQRWSLYVMIVFERLFLYIPIHCNEQSLTNKHSKKSSVRKTSQNADHLRFQKVYVKALKIWMMNLHSDSRTKKRIFWRNIFAWKTMTFQFKIYCDTKKRVCPKINFISVFTAMNPLLIRLLLSKWFQKRDDLTFVKKLHSDSFWRFVFRQRIQEYWPMFTLEYFVEWKIETTAFNFEFDCFTNKTVSDAIKTTFNYIVNQFPKAAKIAMFVNLQPYHVRTLNSFTQIELFDILSVDLDSLSERWLYCDFQFAQEVLSPSQVRNLCTFFE